MKGKRIRRGSLVVIDWLDAHTPETGWNAADKRDFKPSPVRSVGFVLNVGRTAITIAGDGSPKRPHEDSVNRPITIPTGMVKRIRLVRLADCVEL